MLSGLRKDTKMRYRGLMTVCVLTCGLVLAMAAPAMAQDTKPAPAPAAAPAGPTLGPDPVEKPATAAPHDAVTTKPDTGDGKGQENKQPQEMWLFAVLLGGVVLMWIWMGRGRRKQEAKRKEMLSNLKKGDKIVTIGGIIGTVIEVRPDEVTVKVDETNNVRMKFTRRAIAAVGEDAKTTSPDDDKK
jgi:preprotein translocase subunit YajC